MRLRTLGFVLLAVSGIACSRPEPPAATTPAETPAPVRDAPESSNAGPQSVTVQLQPLGASGVGGTVTFRRAAAGLEVEAEVTGLSPGQHGFHVHEFGDCSAPDGNSAGPHFNPTDRPHGAPGSEASHVGDFGNLDADQSGRATLNFTIPGATLDQATTGIIGRSVIVHEKPDDLTTQPTGNSGARIACGVILVPGADMQPVTPRS